MRQNMIFDLGYDEVRKKYIKVKFVIDNKQTYAYFLYSLNKEFNEYGYYNPCLLYKTADLLIDKKHAKVNFCDIDLEKLNDVLELKMTKIDFLIPEKIYEKISDDIDNEIISEMKDIYIEKLDEKFFQTNAIFLISYSSIIKMIKHDNAIKRRLGLSIYPVNEYREYIDKYFPKVEQKKEYVPDNNLLLLDKFRCKKFDEAFAECESIGDVINLSNNIINYLNLKFLNDSEYYIANLKKKNLFLKTAMIYSYLISNDKSIQSVINILTEASEIYNDNLFNNFTSNIISHYSENGNDALIFYYKKSFGNKTCFISGDTGKDIKDLIVALECIDGANNFYKHKSEYLKEENENKDKKLRQKDIEVKELEKKLKRKKVDSVVGIVSAVGAGVAGIATISALLIKKLKFKK